MTETIQQNVKLKHSAFISVGSNMGDKLENCHSGVSELTASNEILLVARSPVYKTEPVDYKDQEWFINYVIEIETALEPAALLKRIGEIQRAAGRCFDPIRFGPRILDMDIIFFDDLIIQTEELVIPHPRMHRRRFVLQPLCDIDPQYMHPILKKSMRALLEDIDDPHQETIRCND